MNHVKLTGNFNGTGAALYLGLGFIPDRVTVRNMEDADVAVLEWNKHMLRTAEMPRGTLFYTAAGILGDPRTVANLGVHPYSGGDVISATTTAYLVVDDADYRKSTSYGEVKKWTLGSSANRTGNFDVEADTTYIGEGSPITIREDMGGAIKDVFIQAMTSNGEQANEVTLSEAVKTGTILKIGHMYDFHNAPIGTIMPAGFMIDAVDVINVSGEMCMFEAEGYI